MPTPKQYVCCLESFPICYLPSICCHGRGRVFGGNGIDRKHRSSSDWATSPQVPETQGSFLTTVLSTTRFPEALRPSEPYQWPNCEFSELRRILRRIVCRRGSNRSPSLLSTPLITLILHASL